MNRDRNLIATYRYMINCVRATQTVLNGNILEELYYPHKKTERQNVTNRMIHMDPSLIVNQKQLK